MFSARHWSSCSMLEIRALRTKIILPTASQGAAVSAKSVPAPGSAPCDPDVWDPDREGWPAFAAPMRSVMLMITHIRLSGTSCTHERITDVKWSNPETYAMGASTVAEMVDWIANKNGVAKVTD